MQEALALGYEIEGEDGVMFGVKREGTENHPYIEIVRVHTLYAIFRAVATGEEMRGEEDNDQIEN